MSEPEGEPGAVQDPAPALGGRRRGRLIDRWWYWTGGAALWLALGLIATGWFRWVAFAVAIYDGGFAVSRYRRSRTGPVPPAPPEDLA